MNRLQSVTVLESAQAYNFEPKYTAEEIAARRAKRAAAAVHTSASGPASDEDPPPPPPPDRMANNHWCTCGNCVPIDQPIQCRCCKEIANCNRLMEGDDDIPCITTHEDFNKVCLEKAVLRTALVARLDCRGHRARLPEELDSESYRYCAYRMFTYWVHGILGKGNRRVIPACAVLKIRTTFPAREGHVYVGYRELPDGELEEVPEELAI
ncbi:P2X purinoceptor 7-like [Lytechinus variegatus]|uniref:P2X purinoceptor 7-like n=1 Tax=Lytechinus variegatus TaxID=7654 RepID=UPI001BB124A9|nr:P2X purinoceptor 7-like [Lytechinus variegatus]